MTDIITVFNHKGGVGKTTISVHLAGALSRRGHRVMLVDADVEGNAMAWLSAGESLTHIRCANLAQAGSKLHQRLRSFVDDNDIIIIDCPPYVNGKATRSALLVSDIALMPVRPSAPDLWSSESTERLLQDITTTNESLRMYAVWNQFTPGRLISKPSVVHLEEMEIPPLETRLGDREVYRHAAMTGSLVYDFDNPKAHAEIDALVDEVMAKTTEVDHAET